MATKKEIMRHLLKGVSLNEAARALRCSKATVAKCAAKMAEGGNVQFLAHFDSGIASR